MLARSLPGVLVYLILWPIIFLPLGFHHKEPLLAWGFAIAMAVISLIRLVQWFYTSSFYTSFPRRWLYLFAGSSCTQAILLGALFVFAIGDPRFESVSFLTALAIAGVASGSVVTLSPRRTLAITNVSCILIPGLVASVITANLTLSALIAIYYLYLLAITIRSNKEYFRAFDNELELEKQREELERLNKIDPLTQIFNRGHFNATLEFQWNNGIRARKEQSLLLIDIDFFKSINDDFGHLFGDACLIFIAELIHQTAKRKTDLIARYGGEEFAVLLPDTSASEALTIAESIRKTIETTPFIQDAKTIKLTASIGVSSLLPSQSVESITLVELADKGLYQAKDAGRNMVCYWKDLEDYAAS